MSRYLAIFPIHRPAPEARHHRAALNQLPSIVPDEVTITGPWTGRVWTDPEGKQWWVMTAPAEGTTDVDALDTARATAHHIDPALVAWIDSLAQPPAPVERPNATKPRLSRLQDLLKAGESIEDATRACGWARTRSAGAAARRAGNLTLARTLEAVAHQEAA